MQDRQQATISRRSFWSVGLILSAIRELLSRSSPTYTSLSLACADGQDEWSTSHSTFDIRRTQLLHTMDKKSNGRTDAGLRSLNHCMLRSSVFESSCYSDSWRETDQNSLPKWRYYPRQKILPVVRFETPYLAWFQDKVRSPMLDSYFAFTANLGTHTFFTVFLPVLFWCGYPSLGRG